MQRAVNFATPLIATVLAAFAVCLPARAQDYPNKAMHLIVPMAAGGTTDAVARLVAQGLSERLGQSVLVDNRPGAGGQIGHEAGMKAAPDGYTLLMGSADGLVIVPALRKREPYDPVKDFTPIGLVALSPMIFAASTKFPANSMSELVAFAKANPGKARYGSAGIGSILHFAVELLKTNTGIDLVHVPYKGGGPMMTAIIAGEVEVVTTSADFAKRFLDTRQLKVLAQASGKRHPLLPNIPTTAEVGMPNIVVVSWFGLLGPAKMPQPVVARLARNLASVLEQPAIGQRLTDVGAEIAPMTPENFGQFIAVEKQKWGKLAKEAGIPVQEF